MIAILENVVASVKENVTLKEIEPLALIKACIWFVVEVYIIDSLLLTLEPSLKDN